MIDTHSHLLPGVDHGSPSLAASLEMAREARRRGIQMIVCTPHLYDTDACFVQKAREALEQLTMSLAEEGIDLGLRLGFEVDLAIAVECEEGELRSLRIDGSGSAILLEMPSHGLPALVEHTVARLVALGYLPILAHPERNDVIRACPEKLSALLAAGAIAQGTAGSLTALHRTGSLETFHYLLSAGYFALLASDAHWELAYTWSLAPLFDEVRGCVSRRDLEVLTKVNPDRILSGKRPLRETPSGCSR